MHTTPHTEPRSEPVWASVKALAEKTFPGWTYVMTVAISDTVIRVEMRNEEFEYRERWIYLRKGAN